MWKCCALKGLRGRHLFEIKSVEPVTGPMSPRSFWLTCCTRCELNINWIIRIYSIDYFFKLIFIIRVWGVPEFTKKGWSSRQLLAKFRWIEIARWLISPNHLFNWRITSHLDQATGERWFIVLKSLMEISTALKWFMNHKLWFIILKLWRNFNFFLYLLSQIIVLILHLSKTKASSLAV